MSKTQAAPVAPTRKQLSRAQRDRRLRNYIRIGAVVVAVLVVGVVTFGIIDQTLIQPGRPVAAVNGVNITTTQFEKYVRYTRMQMVQQYWQLQQYAQFFGADQFQSQLTQIETSFQAPQTIGAQALNDLIAAELVRQEAKKRSITVDAAEVEQKIQEAFSYYPNGTPTPGPTSTPASTNTVAPTREGQPTVTATPTASQTATPTPSATATAGVTSTPTSNPTITPVPSITPTPTPYTQVLFNRDWRDAVGRIKSASGFTDADLRRIFENNLYRTKLAAVWEATPEVSQVKARHILVSSEVTATMVMQQLQAGADFAALAAQYSEDPGSKDTGGEVGYFSKGQMTTEFEIAAFNNPVGLIPAPVQSTYGWHIIEVEDKQMETPAEASQRALSDWITQQLADPLVVTMYDTWWQSHVPTTPALDTQNPPTPFPTSKP